MYALCMSISCLFSSKMKLVVRKFRDPVDFRLHCSLRVSLILLYFISFRAWVENLHIKNRIKNLDVTMPSYFYKENKYKAWKSFVKKAILVTSWTCKLLNALYWSFHCIKVRAKSGGNFPERGEEQFCRGQFFEGHFSGGIFHITVLLKLRSNILLKKLKVC